MAFIGLQGHDCLLMHLIICLLSAISPVFLFRQLCFWGFSFNYLTVICWFFTVEKSTKFLIGPIKFIYSEKATKFCKISTLLLIVCTVVKSKVEISQNFVAFSEYMNFTTFFISLPVEKEKEKSTINCWLINWKTSETLLTDKKTGP